MEDLINRRDAIEVIEKMMEVYLDRKVVLARAWEQIKCLPSVNVQPTCNKLATSCNQLATDCISRQAAIDGLWKLRRGQQMLDDTQTADKVMKGIFLAEQTIKELPSVDIDLSDYSDRLWRNAYEQGKADAEAEIIHCRNCKWYDATHPYGTVNPDAHHCKANDRFYGWDHFCAYGERKDDEVD